MAWRDGHQIIIVRHDGSDALSVRLIRLFEVMSDHVPENFSDREIYVVHDQVFDRLLTQLIDLLAAIRYEHPQMLQLPLVMEEDDAQKLQQMLAL